VLNGVVYPMATTEDGFNWDRLIDCKTYITIEMAHD
jgi:hypothetical protein